MTQARIGILALQGGVRHHEEILDQLGVQHRRVRRVEHLKGIDALILPGGQPATISRLLQLSGMVEPLREVLAGGLPTFGTGAGMDLLATEVLDSRADAAQLAGLDITVRRNAFGRQVDSFETELTFTGLEEPVPAVFIRAPRVERAGPEVSVLARIIRDEGDEVAVAVRQRNVLATSFHPELEDDTRLHRYFMGMVTRTTPRL